MAFALVRLVKRILQQNTCFSWWLQQVVSLQDSFPDFNRSEAPMQIVESPKCGEKVSLAWAIREIASGCRVAPRNESAGL